MGRIEREEATLEAMERNFGDGGGGQDGGDGTGGGGGGREGRRILVPVREVGSQSRELRVLRGCL